MPIKKSVDIDDRVDQVAKMRKAGYIPATEISEKMGNSLTTIARWASEGKIQSVIISGRRYVTTKSLITHITPESAELFGIATSAPKKKTGGVK